MERGWKLKIITAVLLWFVFGFLIGKGDEVTRGEEKQIKQILDTLRPILEEQKIPDSIRKELAGINPKLKKVKNEYKLIKALPLEVKKAYLQQWYELRYYPAGAVREELLDRIKWSKAFMLREKSKNSDLAWLVLKVGRPYEVFIFEETETGWMLSDEHELDWASPDRRFVMKWIYFYGNTNRAVEYYFNWDYSKRRWILELLTERNQIDFMEFQLSLFAPDWEKVLSLLRSVQR